MPPAKLPAPMQNKDLNIEYLRKKTKIIMVGIISASEMEGG